MRRALILAACFAVAGCSSTTAVKQVCLPLKTYTADEQAALAVAVGSLDPANPLIAVLGDYGAMRDADRACLGVKP